ncbi:hypothetical protein FSARC_13309, partial [Fusarium sarcochroum]
MSDSDSSSGIPSWQKAQSDETDSQNTEPAPTPSTSSSTSEVDAPAAETPVEETAQSEHEQATDDEDRLEVARRFLDNDTVRDAPLDQKVEFLKSKGIDEAEIQTLLGQEESSTESETPASSETTSSYAPTPTETLPPAPS